MCDKSDAQVQPYLEAVKRGYAVASLNYRLSGEAIFPAGVYDVKAAIRFLRENARKYNLDKDRFVAAGGSAGGYYTAMLGVLSGRKELEDLSLGHADFKSDVQACVAWYPPTDFLLMDAQLKRNQLMPQDHNDFDSPESRFMGGQITTLDYNYMEKANPLSYVHKGMPPILLQHGRVDHIVPYQQSEIFAKKIKDTCGDDTVKCEIFDTADHADPQFETAENMAYIFSFMENCNSRK
jgi:acetyl esterase/lipase